MTMVATMPNLPAPFKLVTLQSVDSTNAEVRRLAGEGAGDYTLVWAREQTAGRGRRGREWTSPEGNLYFSILLRPPYPRENVIQLGFVMANAIADALSVILPSGTFVHTKWPNDVLVEDRKIAGILMEGECTNGNSFDWLALGVGINVMKHPPDQDVETPATSLIAENVTGDGLSVESLLDTLVKRFLAGQATWRNLGFGPIRRHWMARARGVGGRIRVRLEDETIGGIFSTLDENGALVLGLDDGLEHRIMAGDVFLDPESAKE